MKTEELPDHISHPTYEEELKKVCLIELFKEFERFPSSPDFSLLKRRSSTLWLGSILNGIASFSNIILGLLFLGEAPNYYSLPTLTSLISSISSLVSRFFTSLGNYSPQLEWLNSTKPTRSPSLQSQVLIDFNSLPKFADFSCLTQLSLQLTD